MLNFAMKLVLTRYFLCQTMYLGGCPQKLQKDLSFNHSCKVYLCNSSRIYWTSQAIDQLDMPISSPSSPKFQLSRKYILETQLPLSTHGSPGLMGMVRQTMSLGIRPNSCCSTEALKIGHAAWSQSLNPPACINFSQKSSSTDWDLRSRLKNNVQ